MLPTAVSVYTKSVFTSSIIFISLFLKSPYLLLLENNMWTCHTFPCPLENMEKIRACIEQVFEQVVCWIY